MPCLLGCLALFFPRLVIVVAALFVPAFFRDAYDTLLWPALGFLFLPLTTLAYAWGMHVDGSLQGFNLFLFVLAALMDLGVVGFNARHRRKWWRRGDR